MDTDIDNYSNNEILYLLKLNNDDKLEVNLVFQRVQKTINKLTASSQELENAEEIISFFRNCFVRICVFKGWDITEEMRSGLNLPPLPRIEEKIETSPEEKDIYVNKVLYRGSVPPGIPAFTAVNTHNLRYTRGDVNPIDREYVTSLLTINSKFRPEYTKRSIISQGDRISDLVKCRSNPHLANQVYNIIDCSSNYVTGGYIGETSDFTVELKDPFKDVVSMKLSGVEMINSYYPVNKEKGSNIFTITTFEYLTSANLTTPILDMSSPDISNVTVTPIEIGEGYYNISQMQTTLNTIFGDPSNNDALRAVRMNYNPVSGKVRFFVAPYDPSSNPPIPQPADPSYAFGFNLDFRNPNYPARNIYYNLGWMLGYRAGYYEFTQDYTTIPNIILLPGYNSEAAVNLLGTPYFLLEVDDFNNNNPAVLHYHCNTEHSFNIRNILGKIPNAVHTNEILFEDSSDKIYKSRKYFGPVRIKKLRIRLLDEYGRPINLFKGDWTVNLEITTLNSPYKNITY